MAAQPPLGPRKRSGPEPCAAGWAGPGPGPGPAPPAAAGRSGGALENGFPPHKRPRSSGAAGPEEGPSDPFGDNDDFTADDLEEIDILASQALSQEAAAAAAPPRHAWAAFGASGAERRAAAGQPRGVAPAAGRRPKAASSTEDSLMRDAFQFEVLQTQHEEIKQKLKEMQDEILTKNGEIKILRDSMQQMEYAMEEQKRSYMLLEQQKTQTLSEKEKEFSKKLLSLQSELQFKDAEMNELRTRLQNCERNKHVTQTGLMPSPKKNLAIQVKSEGCSPQPGKRSFPTKESFNAEMSTRPSCSSGNLIAPATLIKEDSKITHPEVLAMKCEAMAKNGSYNSVPKRNARGSILLNALMKQPIVPGSLLGLCHLLSSNSEPPPGAVLQPNYLDTKSTQLPSSRTTQETAPLVSLREAQELAITGLNLIAMDEGLSEGSPTESRTEFSHLTRCKIRGAVHLLPLVEHHIGAYCQAVQLAVKSVNGSCGNHSAVSSRTNTNMGSSKEDFRLSLEETTVISLGILYYLAFYSWDVVHTLLSTEVEKSSAAGDEQVSKMDKNVLCDNQCDNKEDTRTQGGLPVAPQDAPNNDRAQHPLFKKLLQVLGFSAARGSQTDSILNQSLKVLVKLAENSTMDLLINFQHLLSSQILFGCLCPETPLPAVLLTVRLLCILAQHHALVAQLCSHSDTCLLLALYMYITSRPDKSASEMLWLQLEQETVRLLTRCMRCSSPAVLLPDTDCQCNLEVVKALIIMLHRQWMKIRRSENSLSAYKEQIIQFLRDAVLLLHSLSQKDKLFHEHCLEVLHQYDQAMPGVRAILKKTQKLSACEELILDELYPPEPEAEDQGMDSS
ncbi:ATR-interacting protein isoform X3 [Accipiter gentilis]|uniref:ATR-interacting protein isoform X3 n=1 Tax=Astur gentilis TaxID=8957 RepID=UPI002110A27D|nr:ATR-interacting protein isoform X3 [Accipiter gentilis]